MIAFKYCLSTNAPPATQKIKIIIVEVLRVKGLGEGNNTGYYYQKKVKTRKKL